MIESNIKTNNTLSTTSNIIAFWDTKVNPITMLTPSIVIQKKECLEPLKRESEDFENYISLKDARKILNLSAPQVRDFASQLGDKSRKFHSSIYYKKETIDEIQKILSQEKVIDPKDNINNYISNQDLMKMFGISQHQSWRITRSHNLTKKIFNRNIAYYEREKAIEIFSKYQKN